MNLQSSLTQCAIRSFLFRKGESQGEEKDDVRCALFNEELVILSVFSIRGAQFEVDEERGTNLAHLSFR